jgi:hypothetical protein
VSITDNAQGSPQSVALSGAGSSIAEPVISTVTATPANTAATITWTTDVAANSKVDYGPDSTYGSSISDPTLVISHSVVISGLTCNAPYHYRVTSTDQWRSTTSSSDVTFNTAACAAAGPISDDFSASSLNQSLWSFVNPLNDATLSFNGFQAVLNIPGGSSHDPWVTNTAVRLMQKVPNGDFEVEAKFDSILQYPLFTSGSQAQGIIVEQDSSNFLRFDVDCRGQAPQLFSATLANGTPTVRLNNAPIPGSPPHWLRVKRSGNTWTMSWSRDGVTFTTAVTFDFSLNVARAGPWAGNAGAIGAAAPAFTAQIDYFFNRQSPIVPEDGVILSPNFQRIVIDPAPLASVLEKGLGDIDGDGRLDAVIGFDQITLYGVSNPGGIFWYESPHSGVLTDPWAKHTIIASGSAYEDLQVYDVNGDGAIDVIASVNGALEWFENPKGSGLNPASDPWNVHVIGSGVGENIMALGDIDGDGKMDIVTSNYIFFQNSPDSWTRVAFGGNKGGVGLLDIGSGKGAIDVIAPGASSGSSSTPIYWFENPRETGGDARTGTWIPHLVGSAYNADSEPRMATADFNGDGRMDFVTGQAEGNFPLPSDGVIWWEAPADRRNGTWQKHTIASPYEAVHKLQVADLDGNGTPDIAMAEQEQSVQERVSVFLNDGHGNFTEQILSTGSGHNIALGDVDGDGLPDILNAPHGFFGFNHPVELFLNRLR